MKSITKTTILLLLILGIQETLAGMNSLLHYTPNLVHRYIQWRYRQKRAQLIRDAQLVLLGAATVIVLHKLVHSRKEQQQPVIVNKIIVMPPYNKLDPALADKYQRYYPENDPYCI